MLPARGSLQTQGHRLKLKGRKIFSINRKESWHSYNCIRQNILFSFFFYCCSSTVVSVFPSPLPPLLHRPLPLPTLHPTPLLLCPCVLYTCSLMTLPLFPPSFPSPTLSGYSQFVLYFNVSGYILLACLFCLSGSTYR